MKLVSRHEKTVSFRQCSRFAANMKKTRLSLNSHSFVENYVCKDHHTTVLFDPKIDQIDEIRFRGRFSRMSFGSQIRFLLIFGSWLGPAGCPKMAPGHALNTSCSSSICPASPKPSQPAARRPQRPPQASSGMSQDPFLHDV